MCIFPVAALFVPKMKEAQGIHGAVQCGGPRAILAPATSSATISIATLAALATLGVSCPIALFRLLFAGGVEQLDTH